MSQEEPDHRLLQVQELGRVELICMSLLRRCIIKDLAIKANEPNLLMAAKPPARNPMAISKSGLVRRA